MTTDTKVLTETKIELTMCAEPDYLHVARTAVRQAGQSLEIKDENIEQITLAVEEALSNVIRHGYGGPSDKPMILKVSKVIFSDTGKTAMEVLITDFGQKTDVEKIKGRDLEDVKPGGVGVHIMKTVMDEVEFTPNEDSGMTLRMVKYIERT
jgi:anti-sigma regulatory factor (Ser/Thr protein kinase)